VHGIQLKALMNCRLPELPEEYANVEREITAIQNVLRVRQRSGRPLLRARARERTQAAAAQVSRALSAK